MDACGTAVSNRALSVARGGMVLAAVLLLGAAPAVARPRARACPGGRFLVTAGGPLLAQRTTHDPADALQVEGSGIALANGCTLDGVRMHARRRYTLIRAHARTCDGLRNVTLSGRIVAPGCARLDGVLRAHRAKPQSFTAMRSFCGDGVFDVGQEACDAGQGCAAGERCTMDCACAPASGEPPAIPGQTTTTTTPGGGTTTTTVPGGDCHVSYVPFEGGNHVPEGTVIDYVANPPASGPHYPVWARYEDFSVVIPRGYWVHNLEHGAIVIVYRPDAPADVVAALHAAYRAIPIDPECGTNTRSLMTPDPLLDTPFAVVARGHVMDCQSPDTQSVLDFVSQFRARAGGEHDCSEGAYPY